MNNPNILGFIIFLLILILTIYICHKVNLSKLVSRENNLEIMGSIKQPGRFMNTQQNAQRTTKAQGKLKKKLNIFITSKSLGIFSIIYIELRPC